MKTYTIHFKVGGYFRSVDVTATNQNDAKKAARNPILDIIQDLGLPLNTRVLYTKAITKSKA